MTNNDDFNDLIKRRAAGEGDRGLLPVLLHNRVLVLQGKIDPGYWLFRGWGWLWDWKLVLGLCGFKGAGSLAYCLMPTAYCLLPTAYWFFWGGIWGFWKFTGLGFSGRIVWFLRGLISGGRFQRLFGMRLQGIVGDALLLIC